MNTITNLTASAVTARLKKVGLRCASTNYNAGGFSARQFAEWQNGRRTSRVSAVHISWSQGWDTPHDRIPAMIDTATTAMTAAGLNVEILTFPSDLPILRITANN